MAGRGGGRRVCALVVALLLVGATGGGATPERDDGWEATPTGWTSGGVEHVMSMPLDAAVGGGLVVHDDLLVVTSWRGFSIYDISDPELPVPLSTTVVGVQFFNEHPQTDGTVLLLADDTGSRLKVWDISDPRWPEEVGEFDTIRGDHMWTCVIDCTTVYGSRGTILDLTDPANPLEVGDWLGHRRPTGFHSILEVAPGIVFTGTVPAYVLDARDDPLHPRQLASVDVRTDPASRPYVVVGLRNSLPAYMDWPGQATARFALMSMEAPFSGDCSPRSAGFRTYDTTDWEETGTFVLADEYIITDNGRPDDGLAPANVWGCSAYGMAVPPGHVDSGRVAVSWFEHGLRILDVDEDGMIREVGGYITHGGASAIPLWIDDELLYVVDLHRGLDIFRVRGS